MHQQGKYANIYVTYELAGVNHVTKCAVHLPRQMKNDADDEAQNDHAAPVHYLSWPLARSAKTQNPG